MISPLKTHISTQLRGTWLKSQNTEVRVGSISVSLRPCSLETGPQVKYVCVRPEVDTLPQSLSATYLPTYLCTYQSIFLIFLRQYLKVELSNSSTLANQQIPGIFMSGSSPYMGSQA